MNVVVIEIIMFVVELDMIFCILKVDFMIVISDVWFDFFFDENYRFGFFFNLDMMEFMCCFYFLFYCLKRNELMNVDFVIVFGIVKCGMVDGKYYDKKMVFVKFEVICDK